MNWRAEYVLRDLYGSNVFLNQSMVYHYLIGLNITSNERNNCIDNDFFLEWADYFENKRNINVLSNNKFCHFYNGNIPHDCIKMYIPLDYNHIEEGTKMIFDFLGSNGIWHISKVCHRVRSDDVVIRVNNEEDARKIQQFIDTNGYLQEGMMHVNPFCFNLNGIGYAYDNESSYNYTISGIIADYINTMKHNNVEIEKINIKSFIKYIDFTYPFIKNDLSDFSLITNLLKLSMTSNDINDYFKFYRNVFIIKNVPIISNEQYKNYTEGDTKESLLNELILTSMKKYPRGYDKENPNRSGYSAVTGFLGGNIKCITRTNNLRNRIDNNLSVDDVFAIIENSGIPGDNFNDKLYNYIEIIMLNEMIKCSEEKYPNRGLKQVNAFISSGNQDYITNSIGNARMLTRTLGTIEIEHLFARLGVTNLYDYVNNYYTYHTIKNKKSL